MVTADRVLPEVRERIGSLRQITMKVNCSRITLIFLNELALGSDLVQTFEGNPDRCGTVV
jgi:hypothetical protein